VKIAPATETYADGAVMKVPSASSAVTLIRYANDPKVYVIENNQKRWVKTGEDFTKLGYKWSDVKIAPATETYADGAVKTAAATVATFTKTLARNSKGSEVLALQQKLKDLGYFPANVAIVNNFGPTTQKAVKDFQKANNLPQSGTVDAKTRELLNK
jgi:murein L,D-transpeptidase YcbB/YkuD